MSASAPVVGLVDYGTGNYTSVLNALQAIGCEVSPLRDADDIAAAPRMVLPGVGAFGACMRQLSERGLAEPIAERLNAADVPFSASASACRCSPPSATSSAATPASG